MKKSFSQYIVICVYLIFLSGCSLIHSESDTLHSNNELQYYCDQLIQGTKSSNKCRSKALSKADLAKRNKSILEGAKYKEERTYLGAKPKLGLALSGGGTRAATFSIGVMKGLEENGVLNQVEVISSVSGGSYASYWYLNNLFYKDFYQRSVDKFCTADSNSDECDKANTNLTDYGKIDKIGSFGNAIFRDNIDGMLGKVNPTICRKKGNSLNWANCYRYQYTLENSSKILSWSKKPGLWSDIKNFGNTTGQVSLQVLSIPLHWGINGLFDWEVNMTPYRWLYQNGLETSYGYVPTDASLEHFINDEPFLFWPRVKATQLSFSDYKKFLNTDKGKPPYFIINTTGRFGRSFGASHNDERTMEKEIFEFSPWHCGSILFGYKDVEKCGDISWSKAVSISGAAVDGQYSELNDNGQRLKEDFGDDFAAGLLNLFNADLGYHINNYKTDDPDGYKIGIHKTLPFPLYTFHDWWLSAPDLEKDESTSIYLNDGGASENLGLFSLVQRGIKRIIVVDAEYDPNSTFQGAKFLKNTLGRYGFDFELTQEKGINVYDTEPNEAIIIGKIKGLVDGKGKNEDIDLIYIKLSIQTTFLDYPYTVRQYMKKDKAFPHNSTADIFYGSDQFKAYRDLGYFLGKRVGCTNGSLKAIKDGVVNPKEKCYTTH